MLCVLIMTPVSQTIRVRLPLLGPGPDVAFSTSRNATCLAARRSWLRAHPNEGFGV